MVREQSRGVFPFSQCFLYLMACGTLFTILDIVWRWTDLKLSLTIRTWPANLANVLLMIALVALPLAASVWLVEWLASRLLGRRGYPAGAVCHAVAFLLCLYIGSSYVKLLLGLETEGNLRPLVLNILKADLVLILAYTASRIMSWRAGEATERFPQKCVKGALAVLGASVLISSASALAGRASSPPAKGGAAVEKRPNILLITYDGLSASYMSLYGYPEPTTPRLEELAKTSTVFQHAIPNASQTRFALQAVSGRNPHIDGTERLECFGDLLARAGYTQRHFVSFSIFNQGLRDNFTSIHRHDRSLGLPWFRELAATMGRANVIWLGRIAGEDVRFYSLIGLIHPADLMDIPHDYAPPEPVYDDILALLESSPEPVFVWAHAFQPHLPYNPEPGFQFAFGHQTQLQSYLSVIHDLDERLGRLVDELEKKGLLDRTLLIVTSDHGEHFDQGRSFGHGADWLTDDMTTLPLLIRTPGQTQGVRPQATAQQIDIVPTVLAYLGLPVPEWALGESLWPYVEQPDKLSDKVKVCAPGSRFWRTSQDLSKTRYPWHDVLVETFYGYYRNYRVAWVESYKRAPDDPRKVVSYQSFALASVVDMAVDPEKNLLQPPKGDGQGQPVRVRPTGQVKQVLDKIFSDPTVRSYLTDAPWIGPGMGAGLGH